MKKLKFVLLILFFIFAHIKASTWNLIENGPQTCGKVKIAIGTVFNGTQIMHGAYPWNVALIESKNFKFFCGGSLITNNMVLTAAHCIEGKNKNHVFNPKDIYVVLGAHDLSARHELESTTEAVKHIHLHHEWNPYIPAYDADIAILELRRKVTLSEYIQPICIAVPKSEAAFKTEGVIVGFGRSEHTSHGNPENIARKISSPIHSYEFCANSSDHSDLITHRTFCGGYGNGTSVCVGDSGSGLIVQHKGIYYLRGIVSSSLSDLIIGCNITSYSILTDVLEFYSWITTGKDDKTLTQDLVEEVRKLKAKNLELLDKIAEYKANSCTDETSIKPDDLKCYDNKGNVRKCRISDIKCKQYERLTQKFSYSGQPKRKILRNRCQHRVVPLILNGEKARRFEFPHQTLLGFNKTGSIRWLCGGSLISDRFVLTTAVCCNSDSYGAVTTAKLGMSDKFQADERVLVYGIEEIFRHPDFNFKTNLDDIGLLKLNGTVDFNEYIYPICLPTTISDNDKAIFTGFGSTETGGELSNDLMKVTLEKFSAEECQSKFNNQIIINDEQTLCFGNHSGIGGGCAGDSGGPLQIENENLAKCTYTIIGINSFGPSNCGIFGIPDAFTNVHHYLDWIEEIVWGK